MISERFLDFLKSVFVSITCILPDNMYLKLVYFLKTHKRLNLKNPRTYNEKLQWLKLYDRKPIYTIMADKYRVREYVAKKIGEEYLIPLIGIYDNFDEINFNKLPSQFVLKCTHDSGSIVICKEKTKFDFQNAKKKISKHLSKSYYYLSREWVYKNIKHKIICEKYMVDESERELKDYKFFCFHGEPKIIQVDFNRFEDHKRNFYDLKWNFVDLSLQYPNDPKKVISKPKKLDKMIRIASKLSEGINHVRVDLYMIKNDIYFGELTFYPEAGFGKFEPEIYDTIFGNWLKIAEK